MLRRRGGPADTRSHVRRRGRRGVAPQRALAAARNRGGGGENPIECRPFWHSIGFLGIPEEKRNGTACFVSLHSPLRPVSRRRPLRADRPAGIRLMESASQDRRCQQEPRPQVKRQPQVDVPAGSEQPVHRPPRPEAAWGRRPARRTRCTWRTVPERPSGLESLYIIVVMATLHAALPTPPANTPHGSTQYARSSAPGGMNSHTPRGGGHDQQPKQHHWAAAHAVHQPAP